MSFEFSTTDLVLTNLHTRIQANSLFLNTTNSILTTSSENSLAFYLMLLYKQRFLGLSAYTLIRNEQKRISKFIYCVYIKFTKLNIFVTISNTYNEPCFSFSLGQLKLKSAIQRKTHFAFKMLVKTVITFLSKQQAYYYYLNFKGSLQLIKKYFMRFLTLREREGQQVQNQKNSSVAFNALNIILNLNTAHGGCRPRHTPRK